LELRGVAVVKLGIGLNPKPQRPGIAPELRQNGERKPASGEGLQSFPQAFARVWKVDAGNTKKILDVVVFC
jgi:hypothetical protein